jgi:putative transposase
LFILYGDFPEFLVCLTKQAIVSGCTAGKSSVGTELPNLRTLINGFFLQFVAPLQIGGAGRLRSGFDEREQAMSQLIEIDRLFTGHHFDRDVIILCVRWYLRYKLSLRDLVEIMAERGFEVDHSTVHRWALKLLRVLEKAFRPRKRSVGKSWRVGATYIRVKGEWRYLYRSVDKDGNTIDFLLRAHRDKTAARRYFEKAIAWNGAPETGTIDKSGVNLAALEASNADREAPIRSRQSKYLNNLVEQVHSVINRRTRPMRAFKTFRCARSLLAGIELMHMIAKGQMKCARGPHPSAADQFCDLAV